HLLRGRRQPNPRRPRRRDVASPDRGARRVQDEGRHLVDRHGRVPRRGDPRRKGREARAFDRTAPMTPPEPVTADSDLRARNAALEKELARQQSLVEASQSLHSTLDQDELLLIILRLASEAVDAERGTVYLMSADGQEIWSRVVAGN